VRCRTPAVPRAASSCAAPLQCCAGQPHRMFPSAALMPLPSPKSLLATCDAKNLGMTQHTPARGVPGAGIWAHLVQFSMRCVLSHTTGQLRRSRPLHVPGHSCCGSRRCSSHCPLRSSSAPGTPHPGSVGVLVLVAVNCMLVETTSDAEGCASGCSSSRVPGLGAAGVQLGAVQCCSVPLLAGWCRQIQWWTAQCRSVRWRTAACGSVQLCADRCRTV
jgi:hypothetical protein